MCGGVLGAVGCERAAGRGPAGSQESGASSQLPPEWGPALRREGAGQGHIQPAEDAGSSGRGEAQSEG